MPPRRNSSPKPRSRSRSATPAARKKTEKVPAADDSTTSKYKEIFNSIDTNGDGMIDLIELAHAVRGEIHFTPYRVQQLLEEADLDGNGKIDFNEFARVMEVHKNAVDSWGMASKSIWSNFWSRAKETHEIIESVCAPARKLSREHSTTILVEKKEFKEPSAALRVVAHVLGPFLLFWPCVFCFIPMIISPFLIIHCSIAAFLLCGFIALSALSRGQTPGHYVFGLQMVDSEGNQAGFGTLLLKFILFLILNAVTVGCWEIIDGLWLMCNGHTLSDRFLGVIVVCRKDPVVTTYVSAHSS